VSGQYCVQAAILRLVNFDRTRRDLGQGIREWRKRQRLTQDELADAADLHVNALRAAEKGRGNPTLETLWKIATGLKVTLAQLHLGPARE
jgi:XRE family transcriptional regulator, regulator of sulfur utilization